MRASAIKGTAIGMAIGLAVGVGGYTFIYAKGGSYLTNNSAACANCHVMQEHYDAWIKSSHRTVATCNDCHTPAGFIPKYYTKADNGSGIRLRSPRESTRIRLRLKPHNMRVTEAACRKCHSDIVEDIQGAHRGDEATSCVRCHGGVGHPR
jgi:cytochrome c nitrite reductase small subunit